jgi:hypothetical protein
VWLQHARVCFLHVDYNFRTHCDFDTHECDYDTHEYVFNTHKSDFYTQSVTLTRLSVIMTLTKVITTRTSVTYSCVWLLHEQTKIKVRLPSCVWFRHSACDLNNHACDLKTHACDFDMLFVKLLSYFITITLLQQFLFVCCLLSAAQTYWYTITPLDGTCIQS